MMETRGKKRTRESSSSGSDNSNEEQQECKRKQQRKDEEGRVDSKRVAKKKHVSTRKSFEDLPTELVREVFSHCKHKELRNLCLSSKELYLIALSLLYRQFKPRNWTDLFNFERRLDNRIGLPCYNRRVMIDTISRSIREIEIPTSDIRMSHEGFIAMQQRMIESTVQIFNKAINLR